MYKRDNHSKAILSTDQQELAKSRQIYQSMKKDETDKNDFKNTINRIEIELQHLTIAVNMILEHLQIETKDLAIK